MSTRQARVVVAYATVKLFDSVTGKPTVAGFYQGAILPPSADPENVASLVRREYAEWVEDEPTPEPQPPADPEPKAEPAKKAAAAKKPGNGN